jgi:protein transport protein SEC23
VRQVGLAEMYNMVEQTGGLSVQTASFHNPVFKESIKRVFAKPGEEGHLGLASNAVFEVCNSRLPKLNRFSGHFSE